MPQSSVVEQIHSRLIPLAGEQQRTAKWGEQIERDIAKIGISYPLPDSEGETEDPAATDQESSAPETAAPSPPEERGVPDTPAKLAPPISDNIVVEVDTIPESGERQSSTPTDEPTAAVEGISAIAPPTEQMEILNNTLDKLPANFKREVGAIMEDSSVSSTQVEALIDCLLSDSSLHQIADLVFNISGARLAVPKRHGAPPPSAITEAPSKRNVVSILAIILISGAVIFGSWRFLYRPFSSYLVYNRAISSLEQLEYDQANILFRSAQELHSTRRRHLEFAQILEQHGEYDMAATYYQRLLERYPFDRRGALAFARFEAYERGNFSEATALLQNQIERERDNYAIIAELGDIYIVWGDEEDQSKYDEARYYYALLLERYGERDATLARIARYFIRKENSEELDKLIPPILEGNNIPVAVYVDLLRYSTDNNLLDNLQEVITRAKEVDPYSAELHYEAARYFEINQDYAAAEESLQNAISIFNESPPTRRRAREVQILTHAFIGKDKFRERNYDEALDQLTRAINLYEEALENNLLESQAQFGELYVALGDLHYFAYQNWSEAELAYQQAEKNRYFNGLVDYRQGYIKYNRLDWQGALLDFLDANNRINTNNVRYALANTLFNIERYSSAVGHYNEILTDLRQRRANIALLSPTLDPEHRALTEFTIAIYNNAGVGYLNLHLRQPNNNYNGRGLLYLTRGNETLVNYQREDDNRLDEILNLPYINSFAQLHNNGTPLRIYNQLPLDAADTFAHLN